VERKGSEDRDLALVPRADWHDRAKEDRLARADRADRHARASPAAAAARK